MNNQLEIDSICFGYDKTGSNLLSDIYLKVETGTIAGIFGLNGSGKSTLLKIIFGTLKTPYKNIRIDSKYIDKPYNYKNSIGYLPQHTITPSNLTVELFLKMFLNKQDINKLLDDHFISSFYRTRIGKLSGGERRYLEVSALLSLNHSFLMLDEPFSEVEPLYKEKLIDKIRGYSSKKGFLITDHDYRSTFSICDQYYLLHAGCLKKVNSKDDFKKWYLPAK